MDVNIDAGADAINESVSFDWCGKWMCGDRQCIWSHILIFDILSNYDRLGLQRVFLNNIWHCKTVQNLRNQIMTTNLWVEQFWFDHKLVSERIKMTNWGTYQPSHNHPHHWNANHHQRKVKQIVNSPFIPFPPSPLSLLI